MHAVHPSCCVEGSGLFHVEDKDKDLQSGYDDVLMYLDILWGGVIPYYLRVAHLTTP